MKKQFLKIILGFFLVFLGVKIVKAVTLTPTPLPTQTSPTSPPTPTSTPPPCASACQGQGYQLYTCSLPLAQATPPWNLWPTQSFMCGPSDSNNTFCYFDITEIPTGASISACKEKNSNYLCRCFNKVKCGTDAEECQSRCTENGCVTSTTPPIAPTPIILTSNTITIKFVTQLSTPTTPTPNPCATVTCSPNQFKICGKPLSLSNNYWCGPTGDPDRENLCYYNITQYETTNCSALGEDYKCICYNRKKCGESPIECANYCTENGNNCPTSRPGTPTPTSRPGTPTITLPGNTPILQIKINFFGVNSKPVSPPNLDYENQPVKITLKRVNNEVAFSRETPFIFKATVSGNNFYFINSDDLIIPNIAPGNYHLLIKGPKHLQKKFANINLVAGQRVIDLSSQETILPGGDLPLPANNYQQDGKVNALDYAYLVNNFNKTETNVLRVGDLNLDGIINSGDTAVLATTLGEKLDEDGD